MTERRERIQQLADHLAGRFIPFSSDRKPPVLDIGDAIGMAVVVLDFISNGEEARETSDGI